MLHYYVWQSPLNLDKQATNRNRIEYRRSWLYFLESSTLRSNPGNESHDKSQRYISCQAYGVWFLPSIVHADNQHCIAMAKSRKKTPHTEYIALKYHHVIHFVERKHVESSIAIQRNRYVADIFTKPLPDEAFLRLRH